ncbi:hypothetical protein HMPREF3216_00689 [Gardnerella vaginalis]|uniref:Uncharacterized protein n=1 Tax=Gardnerella vaginalis TaxID=2702 RepID=A0A133NPE9_GARVA|nr:hypothetical protein HMPREF3216_00689 [Gardnerella vaginalis]
MAICDFCCATAVLCAFRARFSPYLYYCPPRIIDNSLRLDGTCA